MQRSLFLVVLMVFAAIPAATAHVPPAPIVTCQNVAAGDGKYHEYLPVTTGRLTISGDGNLANCPKPDPIEVGVFSETGLVCTTLNGALPQPPGPVGPPVCGTVNTGVNQPLLDYDGELDHAIGGAWLFVNTGDGVTSGVTACYGWPSVGHHSANVYAQDVLGHGPLFIVTADYSLIPPTDGPDCGDNVVTPCTGPPAPSTLPFPLDVIENTVNGVVNSVTNNPGATCHPQDQRHIVASTPAGPSRDTVPFGPGIDGAYVVFLRHDFDNARLAVAGHVWTA